MSNSAARASNSRAGASNSRASIADLIRVAHVLRADAATLRAAAGMLGLAASVPAPDVPIAPALPVRAAWAAAPAPSRAAASEVDGPAVVRPAGDDPRLSRRFRLTLTEPASTAPPRPLRGLVADLLPSVPVAPAVAEPLFEPWHQRAVLSALAAVDRPGRDVDVDAVVARAARREPVGPVPSLPEPTTRLGVRLLVDHGPSMAPFRRDLRLLAAALRRVVGVDAVEVLAFGGDLREVVPLSGDDDEPRPYPSATGARPILAATNLGIAVADGPRPAEWLALARDAREAGAPLVVLVPYPPARWPAWARALTLVHWDRPTSAGHARRAARRAAAVAGLRR